MMTSAHSTPPISRLPAPHVGRLASGPRGSIADVDGVTVGHSTIAQGDLQTGVTVVRPHPRDPFLHKIPAAAVIINGFGKSAGLMQVNELGVFETPIALTTTLSVGTVVTAQVRAAIAAHAGLARTTTTVNPLVFECNDGYLNDVQSLPITEAHYAQALAAATSDFACGAVGAGRGMSCFGLKGGIGSASRVFTSTAGTFTLGALVLANFGRTENLILAGRPVGALLAQRLSAKDLQTAPRDSGSVIVVLATDAPLDHRQLRRVATRAAAGIGRTGSYYGHGSGDIALAFSVDATVPHESPYSILERRVLVETELDPLFEAAADATEQAIIDALLAAETVRGFAGHVRYALADIAPDWARLISL
jgi:D-aminopeptidase